MTDDVVGKKMVIGFLFAGPTVLLVKKTHPSWHKGLMNGVGGVIEADETPPAAMVREFGEETGCSVELSWRHFCTEMEKPYEAYVYFFAADLAAQHRRLAWPTENDAGEKLGWRHVNDCRVMNNSLLGNLSWLIPLARDPRMLDMVVVTARGDIRERASW